MATHMLRIIAAVAVCGCASAAAIAQPRHAPASAQESAVAARSSATFKPSPHVSGSKQYAVRTQKAGRNPYVDPAAPYKADRLSSPRASEPILNIPGQTTVLTREVLDDMKATSLRDALRSTAGVTIGR